MEQTQAGSSPAEVDVFAGHAPTFEEYSSYKKTGEIPARFKPAEEAESAPADAPEETADESETEPDPEPDEAQEPPHKVSPAEKRIKQLLARVKELERQTETVAKPDAKSDSSTASAAAPATRTKPSVEAKDDKGNPKYATYEDYVEDLADWKAEQQVAKYKAEQEQNQALNALKAKLDQARERYEDADSIIFPAAKTIHDAQIPMAVKEVFSQSEYFPDLCYVVGSDPEELAKFVSLAQSNPRAALAKVFEYERGIKEELAAKTTKTADETQEKAPVKKQTQAPKPPSPVTGGSSRSFDVSDDSTSADEWARQRTQKLRREGKTSLL